MILGEGDVVLQGDFPRAQPKLQIVRLQAVAVPQAVPGMLQGRQPLPCGRVTLAQGRFLPGGHVGNVLLNIIQICLVGRLALFLILSLLLLGVSAVDEGEDGRAGQGGQGQQ